MVSGRFVQCPSCEGGFLRFYSSILVLGVMVTSLWWVSVGVSARSARITAPWTGSVTDVMTSI